MSVTINNSPIHSTSIITYPYGIADSGYNCGWHTGLDFAPYEGTESNPILYSCVQGTVAQVSLTPSQPLGNNVVIQDSNGKFWRYCHMVTGSIQVGVGEIVNTNSVIGRMGATGHVTGIHLHLEHSTTLAWQCSTFLNPATALGIPNVDNTVVYYDGSQPPTPTPTPTPTRAKSKFKWVLYAKKLRSKSHFS